MSSTVRAPFVRLGWVPFLFVAAVVGLARLLGLVWRHPWIASGVLAVVLLRLAIVERGPVVLVPILVAAIALVVWHRLGPDSFEVAVGRSVRSRWRRVWVYRREWQPAIVVTGLEGKVDSRPPRLLSVDSAPDGDRVLVRMAPGQTVDEWQAASKRLAAVFGVRYVRARRAPSGRDRVLLYARRHAVLELDEARELMAPEPRGAFPRAPR